MITYVTHIKNFNSLAKFILSKYHINIYDLVVDNKDIVDYLYVNLLKLNNSNEIYHTWCHKCILCDWCHVAKSFKDCINNKTGKIVYWNMREKKLKRILNKV